ncbi:unnamed protein product, partial [Rodentolepis nana]|uniref:Peptidase S1 domain-containing protein n=1 Tax=Rodentolepis nana TaxID=102285 RepID=A0A0R3TCC0_RODNA
GAPREGNSIAHPCLLKCKSIFSVVSFLQLITYFFAGHYFTNINFEYVCFLRSNQFDSGGPMMCRSGVDGQFILVGIISFGVNCASGYPGIYTRVNSYLDWIREITSNN